MSREEKREKDYRSITKITNRAAMKKQLNQDKLKTLYGRDYYNLIRTNIK